MIPGDLCNPQHSVQEQESAQPSTVAIELPSQLAEQAPEPQVTVAPVQGVWSAPHSSAQEPLSPQISSKLPPQASDPSHCTKHEYPSGQVTDPPSQASVSKHSTTQA